MRLPSTVDIVFGTIMTICGILVISIIGYMFMYIVDSTYTEQYDYKTTVIDKTYKPSSVINTLVYNGKTTTIIPNYVPESYKLIIKDPNGVSVGCTLDKYYYREFKIYDNVSVLLSKGRISTSYYCKEVTRTFSG